MKQPIPRSPRWDCSNTAMNPAGSGISAWLTPRSSLRQPDLSANAYPNWAANLGLWVVSGTRLFASVCSSDTVHSGFLGDWFE